MINRIKLPIFLCVQDAHIITVTAQLSMLWFI